MVNVLLKRISTVLLLSLLALSTVIVIYTRTYNYEEQRHHHVIHVRNLRSFMVCAVATSYCI